MSDFLSQIDPTIDPSGAGMFMQDALDEPAPVLTTPSTLVQLPGGVRASNGALFKEAQVRELTGEDEEAISRLIVSAQGASFETMWARERKLVLERGLVSIGLEPVEPAWLKQLFVGDREAILLGIRIATWGADYDARIPCKTCKEDKDIIFELDKDITYKTVDDPYELTRVKLRNGKVAALRHIMVEDQDYALGDGKLSPAEMNTRLLSRVIHTVDDVEVEVKYPGGTLAYAKRLGMKDRQMLAETVTKMAFGPQLGEVVVACPDCGTDWKGSLSLSALF